MNYGLTTASFSMQRQGKCHLKTNICAIVTKSWDHPIFRILLYNVDEVCHAERDKEQLLLPTNQYLHVSGNN